VERRKRCGSRHRAPVRGTLVANGRRGVSSRGDSRRWKAPRSGVGPHRSRGGSKSGLRLAPRGLGTTRSRSSVQRATMRCSVVPRVGLCAPVVQADSWSCRPVATLPSGARGVSFGGRAVRKSRLTPGRRNAPKQRVPREERAVQSVCPCSLTVAEVGWWRTFGVGAFGRG
jgi:hypothetical protein